MHDAERFEAGMINRRAVLGDAHVDRSIGGTTEFNEPFHDFITRYAWGEIWARPGLDWRTRSLITLAMLIALNREEEFKMHVAAAMRNGVTQAELQELLLHAGIYCGLPAANNAFKWAASVLDGNDETAESGSGDGQR